MKLEKDLLKELKKWQKIMFKVGSWTSWSRTLGKVTIGKQSTIYIGKDGMQHETDALGFIIRWKGKRSNSNS